MLNREAILASIIANPEDDTPRLIYADCIEEDGYPRQAHFIRVQIWDAHSHRVLHPECDKCKNLLAARSDLALKAMIGQHSYSVGIPQEKIDGHKPMWLYRRGFLEEIRVDWLDFAGADGRTLMSMVPMRKVVLLNAHRGLLSRLRIVYPGVKFVTESSDLRREIMWRR